MRNAPDWETTLTRAPPKPRICLASAAGAALALEPLAWRGAGTVSRTRDHGEKRLTDYVAFSHRIILVYETTCGEVGGCSSEKLFHALVGDMVRLAGTNLSLGTLLPLSLHLAPLNSLPQEEAVSLQPGIMAEKALSEAMRFPFSALVSELSRLSPRYTARMKSWLFPDIGEPFKRTGGESLWSVARVVSEFDPVMREVYEGWWRSRRLAGDLRRRRGGGTPGSEDLDWLYSRACELAGVDYLVFRRGGLKAVEEELGKCARGELGDLAFSLGSVADVVAMSVFYYLVQDWGCGHYYIDGWTE